ncbi:sugar phosphate isomerase/epimerase family protein [Neobacillus sp. OS1-2]|uniref:sugar phosphate isomerase/epimerase family protein n=1 Tax=Neobacillus sp. OS1-2 TaxID=3070680 RepID=UPI0027E0C9DF|nr:sugar phosphate isomerase/epimerase family protein [Neobacillus sp. OS1-2]WML41396.1 sugar phosphate isomerase/epimerase family protein [Neobacillus sp. OS1-2]
MGNRIIPSLLVTEVFFPVKDEKGFAAGVVENLGSQGFYRSFEIGDGYDQEDRNRILRAKEQNNLSILQWLTFLTYKTDLNVSAIDASLRGKTVKQIKESLYLAAECGVSTVAFVPGPDPGIHLRKQGLEAFYESLCEICEEAATFNMHVSIEAMDREVHKKRVLGPTSEAVPIISKVKEKFSNVGLVFDTAHVALNGEDIFTSLDLAKATMDRLHFANVVLDPESPLYGDNHMPIGEPGFLTVEKMSRILRKADELGIQAEKGLPVAVEVQGRDKIDYFANERTIRAALESAMNLVESN